MRETEVRVGGTRLSGLVAGPEFDCRALIVAIHGAGMHAGYFDAQTGPGLSLLQLAGSSGYLAWAPDRPGVGASAGLGERDLSLVGQSGLLLRAIDEFRRAHRIDGPVLLVGHSYGMKVALTMASLDDSDRLMGVDGSGAALDYAFDWKLREASVAGRRRVTSRSEIWGPAALYPPGTIGRRRLPVNNRPAVMTGESAEWPAQLRALAPAIRVPLRITIGGHDGLWRKDDQALAELGQLFAHTPCSIHVDPHAAHNVSLGWAARSYHLGVLTFLESCLLRRRLSHAPAHSLPRPGTDDPVPASEGAHGPRLH